MEENLEIRKTRKEDIPQIKQIFCNSPTVYGFKRKPISMGANLSKR